VKAIEEDLLRVFGLEKLDANITLLEIKRLPNKNLDEQLEQRAIRIALRDKYDLEDKIKKFVKDIKIEIETAKKDDAFNHDQSQYYRGKKIAFSQVITKLKWFGIVEGEEIGK